MFQAAKEAQSIFNWLAPLLPFLHVVVAPVQIFNDNDGASALALDPVGRFKNKHVRMEHHYTQELVAAGVILPVRVDTSENKSDLLTKALGPTVFPKLAASLVGSVAPPAPRVLMFRAVSSPSHARVPVSRVSDIGTQCDFNIDLAGSAPAVPLDSHASLSERLTVIDNFNVECRAIHQNYCEQMRVATNQLRVRLGGPNALSGIPGLAPISSLPRVNMVEISVNMVEELPSVIAQAFIARSPRESLAISRSRQHNEAIAPPRRNDFLAPTGRYCINCRRTNHDTAQCRYILTYSDRTHLKRGR